MSEEPDKQEPKPGEKKNDDVDRQVEQSFPASDPPSYTGGHSIGEPARSEKDKK